MKNSDTNFIFFGTPDVASVTLEILQENGFLPSLVVTSPDKRKGRKLLVTPPPVKIWAEKNRVSCIQPVDIDDKLIYELESKKSDLFIVVTYGKILPEKIIKMPKFGSVNIHYSLLPKYRGASPVESAILNGDEETGVTIQEMEYKMDAGPVLAQEKTVVPPEEKAEDLRKRLIKIGGELLVTTLPQIIHGKLKPIPQNEDEATYSKKIKKEDGLIDLSGDPIKNYNKWRAYSTWPRTFFFSGGKRIVITEAELLNGEFKIKKVIPEGRKEIKYEEFIKIPT